MRRLCAETAVLIHHRQQSQADADFLRRLNQANHVFHRIGIRLAIAAVMQIVEFADRGIACLQHLDIQLHRNRLQVDRRQLAGKLVHQGTPAPKIVVQIGAIFSQPRHSALKRMRMQVCNARQHRADGFGSQRDFRGVGTDARQDALIVPFQQYIVAPAFRQQGAIGDQLFHENTPFMLPCQAGRSALPRCKD